MSDVAAQLDQLRIALGEVNILAIVTAATYDSAEWSEPDPDAVEGVASLLGLIVKSATSALDAFHRLHGAIADAQPVATPVERWTGEGTAPGGEVMSAEDAEIVRCIRERCQDGRFDGSSDAELLQLFKRNKRVLNRSDEDVIAAMVSCHGSHR